MIVAEFSFPSILIRFLLLGMSVVLWPQATLAQVSPDAPIDEQLLPLTGEQADQLIEEQTYQLTEAQALAHIRVRLEEERSDEALRLIERFLDQSEPSVFIDQFTFLHALALEAGGQVSQAIITLEQFLEEYPGSALIHDARLKLGTLYIESQRPDRAIPVLSRVLDLTPDEPGRAEALRQLLLAYEAAGEYLRAIQTALTHANQSGKAKRRDLLDYVQTLLLHRTDRQSLGVVMDAFPGTYPGDLALIRLIELHQSQGDEVLAERDIRAFLQRFPDHPYAQTAGALLRTVVARIKAHRHVIAAVFPFSGNMKPFGTDAFNGVRLALEEEKTVGGPNAVGLVVKDSVLPPAALRRDIAHLLEEFSPIALIGPLLAREVQLLAETPDAVTVPFITPTATLPDVKRFGRYWFSTAMTSSLQINRLVDYAMGHVGHTRFCMLIPETTLGRQWYRLFQEAVVRNGGEIIAAEWYRPGTTDASAQIARIKQEDLRLYGEMVPPATEEPADSENGPVTQKEAPLVYAPGFDALFLPGHPTDVAFLAAQLAFFDVNVPLLGTNTWNHPNLLKWGRSSIEGGTFGDVLFLETTDPETRRFIAAYRERYQADPSIFAVQAYEAMRVVIATLRRGATTGPDVRRQLFIRHDLPTLGGMKKFDRGGILTRKVYMIGIQNGRFIQLN